VKLLIVEDEVKTGDYLQQGLGEAGFNADLARTGLDGLNLAMNQPYDLIILDGVMVISGVQGDKRMAYPVD
jgi:two-component system copper resistance phosphate regulon response regulator CusR